MAEKTNRSGMGYSNSYRSLEAIWTVLREHSSKEHPITVREICDYLKGMVDAPSPDTVKRLFPEERNLMSLLYPGIVAQSDGGAVGAYRDSKGLHVIVETPEGDVLSEDAMDVEIASKPFQVPSYSTVDKLLKERIPFDLKTFPFQLKCVAKTRNQYGKVRYVPYDEFEDLGEKNNQPRRYYLANVLTDAEWRIFSDLVRVYPYISERQTKKFLTALNHMQPRKTGMVPSRYAYKRGSDEQFKMIRVLDEAIAAKKKVRVTYGEYRLTRSGGKWGPVLKQRERNDILDMEPYALMWSNGYYYLVAKHRGMMNLRVDRILDVKELDESYEIPQDFDLVRYRDSSPVMYPGESEFVRMRCRTYMLNVLMDFFGPMAQYTEPKIDETDGNEYTEVTMMIAPSGVKLFALQYMDGVEVLEPQSLRDAIKETLENAEKKYCS